MAHLLQVHLPFEMKNILDLGCVFPCQIISRTTYSECLFQTCVYFLDTLGLFQRDMSYQYLDLMPYQNPLMMATFCDYFVEYRLLSTQIQFYQYPSVSF